MGYVSLLGKRACSGSLQLIIHEELQNTFSKLPSLKQTKSLGNYFAMEDVSLACVLIFGGVFSGIAIFF